MTKQNNAYQCWAYSHRGLVRPNNEDAFAVSPTMVADEHWNGRIPAEGWVFIADGMGGHAAGQVASRLAVECLSNLADLLRDDDGIEGAIEAVHAAICSAMRQNLSLAGMGTTVAGVVLSPDEALCFNVGDSRIYHMGEKLSLLSEDHVIDGHVLTQCLGGLSEQDVPQPATLRVKWKEGQRLLLCTDGLTDMLDDDEIATIMDRARTSPAEALVDAALHAGGRDNVTVIVLERLG
jgi:serine/threonine protein phosphatase PrpC